MNIALRQTWIGIRLVIFGTIVLGLIYPLLVTGIGQVAANGAANGSLITGENGTIVGSSLIGQNFSEPQWFHPRPSVAGSAGYDAQSSGASNLGPNNEDLLKAVEERRAAVIAEDGPGDVPADALTASGSGLDPHISPEYAQRQVSRVARENGLTVTQVTQLVAEHTQERMLGFLGEPRVNVLELNLAISQASRRH